MTLTMTGADQIVLLLTAGWQFSYLFVYRFTVYGFRFTAFLISIM